MSQRQRLRDPATTANLPPSLCEREFHLPLVNFNTFLVSTSQCEDLQRIGRAYIEVDHLTSEDVDGQVVGVWDRDICWFKHHVLLKHHT